MVGLMAEDDNGHMEHCAAALDYIARGLSVLPLHPYPLQDDERDSKHPCLDLVPHWGQLRSAPATEADVREWYRLFPDAGVGIIATDGLVVLDVDDPESLNGQHLPPTPTVRTDRGWHYYYRVPEGVTVAATQLSFGELIVGGYVAAPPSVHPSGHVYEWADMLGLDAEFAELPEWLRNGAVPKPRRRAPAPTPLPFTVNDELEAWRAILPGLQWNGRSARARCPFHDDEVPSLALGYGHDGRLHWTCWARCEATGPRHCGDLRDLERMAGRAEALRRARAWIAANLEGDARTLAEAVADEAGRHALDAREPFEGLSYRRLARLSGLERITGPGPGVLSQRGRRIRRALDDLAQAGCAVRIGTQHTKGARGSATSVSLPCVHTGV